MAPGDGGTASNGRNILSIVGSIIIGAIEWFAAKVMPAVIAELGAYIGRAIAGNAK